MLFCLGPLGENRVSRPPLPKCMTTKFGCCKDNETIAQGKDFLGCPGNLNFIILLPNPSF